MKKLKFIIMSESYNENIGGYVVLHKLCDELNRLGFVAKLFPAFNSYVVTADNILIPMLKLLKERYRRVKRYKTNPNFITPVATKKDLGNSIDDLIVVYPETISGNPLRAKKVVRWFLHHPGYHNHAYFFGCNELYFKFHSGISVPNSLSSSTSSHELRIVHYPLHLYNLEGASGERKGSAYAIRKGIGKRIVHDLSDSVLIDGKSHEEVARIFKTVRVFYSYDPYTAYTTFAPLCGCDSVIIPDEGVSVDDWVPDKHNRAGIAYGIESIEQARKDRNILVGRVNSELERNSFNVMRFIEEVHGFFFK